MLSFRPRGQLIKGKEIVYGCIITALDAARVPFLSGVSLMSYILVENVK